MLLVPVLVHVMLGGFCRMMLRVQMMPMRYMGVMAGGLVIPGFMMFRRVTMMLCGVFVVLGRLAVMFGALLGHANLSGARGWAVKPRTSISAGGHNNITNA